MSLECSECERDLRGEHAPGCSRHPDNLRTTINEGARDNSGRIRPGLLYVVWSFEHRAWWGPNRQGYVKPLSGAGRYTAEQAGRIVTDSILGDEVALLYQVAAKLGPPTVPSLWHNDGKEDDE